jgi:hypothetical protein
MMEKFPAPDRLAINKGCNFPRCNSAGNKAHTVRNDYFQMTSFPGLVLTNRIFDRKSKELKNAIGSSTFYWRVSNSQFVGSQCGN